MGLFQNGIETSGISTTSISVVPGLTMGVGVPRALYVRFPYGNPFGDPGNAEKQRQVLLAALHWLYEAPASGQLWQAKIDWRRMRGRRRRSSRG